MDPSNASSSLGGGAPPRDAVEAAAAKPPQGGGGGGSSGTEGGGQTALQQKVYPLAAMGWPFIIHHTVAAGFVASCDICSLFLVSKEVRVQTAAYLSAWTMKARTPFEAGPPPPPLDTALRFLRRTPRLRKLRLQLTPRILEREQGAAWALALVDYVCTRGGLLGESLQTLELTGVTPVLLDALLTRMRAGALPRLAALKVECHHPLRYDGVGDEEQQLQRLVGSRDLAATLEARHALGLPPLVKVR